MGQAVVATACKRAPAAAAVGAAVCAFVAAVFVGLAAVPAGKSLRSPLPCGMWARDQQ